MKAGEWKIRFISSAVKKPSPVGGVLHFASLALTYYVNALYCSSARPVRDQGSYGIHRRGVSQKYASPRQFQSGALLRGALACFVLTFCMRIYL